MNYNKKTKSALALFIVFALSFTGCMQQPKNVSNYVGKTTSGIYTDYSPTTGGYYDTYTGKYYTNYNGVNYNTNNTGYGYGYNYDRFQNNLSTNVNNATGNLNSATNNYANNYASNYTPNYTNGYNKNYTPGIPTGYVAGTNTAIDYRMGANTAYTKGYVAGNSTDYTAKNNLTGITGKNIKASVNNVANTSLQATATQKPGAKVRPNSKTNATTKNTAYVSPKNANNVYLTRTSPAPEGFTFYDTTDYSANQAAKNSNYNFQNPKITPVGLNTNKAY